VRLYLNVDDDDGGGGGVNELKDWTVELCGNDTRSSSDSRDFYSSSSQAILELHTGHHHRRYQHHHTQQQQQQQQHRDNSRPRFLGFRGTFRFLLKGRHTFTHDFERTLQ